MKARLGHVYFTFKVSNCVDITSSRGYVKGKCAAVAMVAVGAAGVGVAALVTVITFSCRRGKKSELRSISPESETVNRHGR